MYAPGSHFLGPGLGLLRASAILNAEIGAVRWKKAVARGANAGGYAEEFVGI